MNLMSMNGRPYGWTRGGNPHGGPLPGVEELSRGSREVRVKLLENSET
jgi:hypothetical protein